MLNGEQFADLDLDISERVLLNVFFRNCRLTMRWRSLIKNCIFDHCTFGLTPYCEVISTRPDLAAYRRAILATYE